MGTRHTVNSTLPVTRTCIYSINVFCIVARARCRLGGARGRAVVPQTAQPVQSWRPEEVPRVRLEVLLLHCHLDIRHLHPLRRALRFFPASHYFT